MAARSLALPATRAAAEMTRLTRRTPDPHGLTEICAGVQRIMTCEIGPLIPANVETIFRKEGSGVLNSPRVESVLGGAAAG